MITTCSFAACDRPGTSAADGFRFCPWHLRVHRVVQAEDMSTPSRTSVDQPATGVVHTLTGPFTGHLLPSRSLRAARDVLARHAHKQGAA